MVEVSEAFTHGEDFVVAAHAHAAANGVADLEREAREMKLALLRDVEAQATVPRAVPASMAAIHALHAGLLCGALDGVITMVAGQTLQDPPMSASAPGLQPKVDLLVGEMARGREVAGAQWRGMEADDLHLLSGYGKHENRNTAEEAAAAAEGASPLDWQTFLLASFKAGYAVGLVDATLVSVHGQKPGQ